MPLSTHAFPKIQYTQKFQAPNNGFLKVLNIFFMQRTFSTNKIWRREMTHESIQKMGLLGSDCFWVFEMLLNPNDAYAQGYCVFPETPFCTSELTSPLWCLENSREQSHVRNVSRRGGGWVAEDVSKTQGSNRGRTSETHVQNRIEYARNI